MSGNSLAWSGAVPVNCWLADTPAATWHYMFDGDAALVVLPGDGTVQLQHFPPGNRGDPLPAPDAVIGTGAPLQSRSLVYFNAVSRQNVGADANEEVLWVWPVPALTQTGDTLHTVFRGSYVGAVAISKTFRLYYGTDAAGHGGTQIGSVNNAAAAGPTGAPLECWLSRSGPNTQRAVFYGFNQSNSAAYGQSDIAVPDRATHMAITAQVLTTPTANAMAATYAMVELLPAAPGALLPAEQAPPEVTA